MTELITAATAAAERGIGASWMRDLIRIHGVVAVAREPGRSGGNLYRAGELRAIPVPGRGVRNDLLGERIGQLFGMARRIAEARGARDEYDKYFEQLLDGNPLALRGVVVAARRWAKRKPVPTAVAENLTAVERLGAEIEELPEVLSISLRSRIIRADAATRNL